MGTSFIEAVGYLLGKKAAQAKNAFDLMSGTDEESVRAEIRLGHDMAQAVLERTPLVEENEDTRYIAQIGRWLAGHIKEKQLPFAVRVTAEREPHALALPGGSIFMSFPLLEIGQERDEIAFLIAHEMGHIVLRHTLDRIVKDAALSLLLRQSPGRHAARAWLNEAGRGVLSRAFSKEAEFEADLFAEELVKRAGGDALAGQRLFERMASNTISNQGLRSGYFADHPSPATRLSNLLKRHSRDVSAGT